MYVYRKAADTKKLPEIPTSPVSRKLGPVQFLDILWPNCLKTRMASLDCFIYIYIIQKWSSLVVSSVFGHLGKISSCFRLSTMYIA